MTAINLIFIGTSVILPSNATLSDQKFTLTLFMLANRYRNAQFLTSSALINQLPPDTGYEVAFAGRSNAGKSTALNVLTQQKNLARTSKTPGRTQLINLFSLDDTRRLVDLPGYGYAKVSFQVKQNWQNTLAHYLELRTCLRGVILLMDCRHPLQPLDREFILQFTHGQLPLRILLTKADKLSRNQAKNCLTQVKKQLQYYDWISVQTFSAHTQEGLDELILTLNTWFDY